MWVLFLPHVFEQGKQTRGYIKVVLANFHRFFFQFSLIPSQFILFFTGITSLVSVCLSVCHKTCLDYFSKTTGVIPSKLFQKSICFMSLAFNDFIESYDPLMILFLKFDWTTHLILLMQCNLNEMLEEWLLLMFYRWFSWIVFVSVMALE